MARTIKAALLFAALVGLYQVAAGASGSSLPAKPSEPARTLTPEEMAVGSYNSGLDHRDRGVKAEEKAAKDEKASDRVKDEKKARD